MPPKSHKKQHTVPKCYLKEWCDLDTPPNREPYVWIFGKDGGIPKKHAPKNIFSEKDFYTVTRPDGKRDLWLERKLSELEHRFMKIRREKLDRCLPLSTDDRADLMLFVAAAHFRARSSRDHHTSQFQNLLKRFDEIDAKLKTATPEELDQWKSLAPIGSIPSSEDTLDHENVRELVRNPITPLMLTVLNTTIQHLGYMNITIFITENPIGFITSDCPVGLYDPIRSRFPPPWNGLALSSRTIQVVMPLSPRQCLLFTKEGFPSHYIRASDSIVDEINRLHRFSSDKHFIVRKNMLKHIWFSDEPVTQTR